MSSIGPLPKRRKVDGTAEIQQESQLNAATGDDSPLVLSSVDQRVVVEQTAVKSEETETPPVVPQLKDDCLVQIFQLLPLSKRIWMEQICRHWKKAVVPKSLSNVKSLEVGELQRNCGTQVRPNLLHLSRYQILKSVVDRIGVHLESVTFNGNIFLPCQFGIREMLLLQRKCPNLKTLVLGDATVIPRALQRLGTELSRLESLSFSQSLFSTAHEIDLSMAVASMPQLKEMSFEGSFTGAFLRHLPNSIVSVTLQNAYRLEVTILDQFLGSHQGLKKFELTADAMHPIANQQCRDTITRLAQHCPQLERLIFANEIVREVQGSLANDRTFADAFKSLKQLKTVVFGQIRLFNLGALKSLCDTDNCPNIEDLDVFVSKPEEFGTEAFMHIAKLEKLKRLGMNMPIVDLQHSDVLWRGIGATLEYLDISEAQINDASLHEIGLKCTNLAQLVIKKRRRNMLVTVEGLKSFIKAIVDQESWNDPLKSRRLQIDVYRRSNVVWPIGINLDAYRGRVKINPIENWDDY